MREWLLTSFFGKYIRDYEKKGGVTPKKKAGIILLMTTMVLVSALYLIPNPVVKYIVLGAGVVGSIVVIFFVPTAHDDSDNAE